MPTSYSNHSESGQVRKKLPVGAVCSTFFLSSNIAITPLYKTRRDFVWVFFLLYRSRKLHAEEVTPVKILLYLTHRPAIYINYIYTVTREYVIWKPCPYLWRQWGRVGDICWYWRNVLNVKYGGDPRFVRYMTRHMLPNLWALVLYQLQKY